MFLYIAFYFNLAKTIQIWAFKIQATEKLFSPSLFLSLFIAIIVVIVASFHPRPLLPRLLVIVTVTTRMKMMTLD